MRGESPSRGLVKNLDIVYEDDSCIVVNKPAGLAVQGGKGINVSLDDILAASFAERPLLVHRLDRDTSGLVLVAKNKSSAAVFAGLFAGASVKKSYLAVCSGRPAEDRGTIRLDLEVRGAVKKSETRYRLLEELSGGAFSLLELELGTGRMHQIRRHLAMAGTPVLGDDRYGDFRLNRELRRTRGLRRLLLHARRLVVPETPDGPGLDVEAPPPGYFLEFLEAARWPA